MPTTAIAGGRRGPPPAVVVGLDCITGLQTARVLARHGVPVVGVAGDRRHFCCRTRACQRIVAAPPAGERLADALVKLGPRLRRHPAALFPVTDDAVRAISADRERLAPWYRLALPPHEVVETLMDKVRFARHATANGLPIPTTVVLCREDDPAAAAERLRFPVVAKPALKTAAWWARAGTKALRIGDAEGLVAFHARARGWSDRLIVQEWIPGGEDALYSWNGYVLEDGTVVGSFIARKIRQWPPHTGTSALGEEVRNDEVLAGSLRLIGSVPYRGLGYVEMKRHAETGEHFIVEPNVGRPTGRSTIAEAGGVDLHYAAYCDMVGLPLPANLTQRYGAAKWIYLRHDLQAAVTAVARGELTVADWARSMHGVTADAVFARDDPGPFFADLAATASAVLGVGARRLRSRLGGTHA